METNYNDFLNMLRPMVKDNLDSSILKQFEHIINS